MTLIRIILNSLQAHQNKPVLVAGDPERAHMKLVNTVGGIDYHDNQIKSCNELAERLKIKPIRFVDGK